MTKKKLERVLTRDEVLSLLEEGKEVRKAFSKKIRKMEQMEQVGEIPEKKKNGPLKFTVLTLPLEEKKHVYYIANVLAQVQEKFKIIENEEKIQLVFDSNSKVAKAATLGYMFDKTFSYSYGEEQLEDKPLFNYF